MIFTKVATAGRGGTKSEECGGSLAKSGDEVWETGDLFSQRGLSSPSVWMSFCAGGIALGVNIAKNWQRTDLLIHKSQPSRTWNSME